MTVTKRLAALLLAAVLLTGCAVTAPAETAGESASAELEVHFFDAGKADAILLTAESGTVLIDAGEKGFGKTILTYLKEKCVERIDYLIVTHFDKDHVGGAAKVLNGITVGTVLQSNQPKDSEEYENYCKALKTAGITPVTVRETLSFTLSGVTFTVDPPRRTEYGEDESNNSSLIVTVQNGNDRFLFTGDAQTQRIAEFLDTEPAACGVLKLPHHGQDEALLGELLSAVQPKIAVITSSDDEPESEAVVEALEQAGVQILLTRNGAFTLQSDGNEIAVIQQ